MNTVQKLIDIFKKFPTVGRRSAGRFAYYLMKIPKEQLDELISALQELKQKIKLCNFCFNPFEFKNNESFCPICADPRREKSLLCIVEKEMDLETIEKTKKYNGLYFILGGTVGNMRKEDLNNLRLEQLIRRIKETIQAGKQFSEIIIALNPTQEGKATSSLVERALKETGFSGRMTHLAQGIPAGGELEYADDETLESALSGRK